MVFYAPESKAGNMLAENVISAICAKIGKPLRSSNPGDYFVTRESIPPAIIIECGFLSNSSDEKQLLSPAYKHTLAQGIAAGISAFFNIQYP